MKKKGVRCKPIVSVRLTSHYGTTKIVSSCEGAISWWCDYKLSEWVEKNDMHYTRGDPGWEAKRDLRQARLDRYARRCRPYFERVFGVK